jgi:cellulose synthase/poly-beta-1,6-N-acetylglucosamine synthase-like glycosyltransferase
VTPARPRLNIVIPTYERCALLQQAVDSALAQDAGDYEVVIVDDASHHETWDDLDVPGPSRVRGQATLGRDATGTQVPRSLTEAGRSAGRARGTLGVHDARPAVGAMLATPEY